MLKMLLKTTVHLRKGHHSLGLENGSNGVLLLHHWLGLVSHSLIKFDNLTQHYSLGTIYSLMIIAALQKRKEIQTLQVHIVSELCNVLRWPNPGIFSTIFE